MTLRTEKAKQLAAEGAGKGALPGIAAHARKGRLGAPAGALDKAARQPPDVVAMIQANVQAQVAAAIAGHAEQMAALQAQVEAQAGLIAAQAEESAELKRQIAAQAEESVSLKQQVVELQLQVQTLIGSPMAAELDQLKEDQRALADTMDRAADASRATTQLCESQATAMKRQQTELQDVKDAVSSARGSFGTAEERLVQRQLVVRVPATAVQHAAADAYAAEVVRVAKGAVQESVQGTVAFEEARCLGPMPAGTATGGNGAVRGCTVAVLLTLIQDGTRNAALRGSRGLAQSALYRNVYINEALTKQQQALRRRYFAASGELKQAQDAGTKVSWRGGRPHVWDQQQRRLVALPPPPGAGPTSTGPCA